MSKTRRSKNILAYYSLEVLVTAGVFFLAYYLRSSIRLPLWQDMKGLSEYTWLFIPMVFTWCVMFLAARSYYAFRTRPFWQEVLNVSLVEVLGSVFVFAYITVTKTSDDVNRSFIGVFAITHLLVFLLLRQGAKHILMYQVRSGYDRQYVLIVGTGQKGRKLLKDVRENIYFALSPRGFISESPDEVGRTLDGLEVIGSFGDLSSILQKEAVDEVYFALDKGNIDDLSPLIEICDEVGVKIKILMNLWSGLQSRLTVERMMGEPVLTLYAGPTSETKLFIKRTVDVVLSFLFLVCFSWLYLLIAIIVKATSSGPVFFRQERAGLNSRVFALYKFRTMAEGAEKQRQQMEGQNEMSGPVFKIKGDPRVTGVGRILRRTSLDELPQLWNVLRGDMSLVGPRPLPVYEVAKFERWQRRRMSMRPGITCLWQVKGRNQLDFARWMELDLKYIDNWSLALDFNLLLRTIPAVFSGKGAY